MKKLVLIFGLIAGLISCALFLVIHFGADSEIHMEHGELIGYSTMIIALSSIFFAVRQYRDQYLDGTIKFGKAFLVGLYITLIASLIYTLAWEGYFRSTDGRFADQYVEQQKSQLAEEGMSEAEITETMASQVEMMEMYKNNTLVRMGFTFMEIFPVGLIISLICGLIFGVFLKPKES